MKSNPRMNFKTVALWLVLFLLFAGLFRALDQGNRMRKEVRFSEFVQMVKTGKISEVTFKSEDQIVATLKEPAPGEKKQIETIGDTSNAKIYELLTENNIFPNYERSERTPVWQQMLISWFPMLLLFLFFFVFMRQIQVGGGNQDHSFIAFETIHLDQELVQSLFALVVSAPQTCAAVTTDRIDLVDENDTWLVLLALFKKIPHARGAHADKHLDEIRT